MCWLLVKNNNSGKAWSTPCLFYAFCLSKALPLLYKHLTDFLFFPTPLLVMHLSI